MQRRWCDRNSIQEGVAVMKAIEVGMGLPSAIDGVTREQLITWSRQAEGMGASSLVCTDRIMYPSLETMLTLAAVSSVTERARLMTSVLVAPLRSNGALFRKQVDTLDRLTDHRLVLGVGVGRREDDYEACDVEFTRRGRLLDDQLGRPAAPSGPDGAEQGAPSVADVLGSRLLFGGQGPATLRRIGRYGGGWVAAAGLGAWTTATAFATEVRNAWTAAGRPGRPRLAAMIYTSAGPDARGEALRHMHSYYAFLGQDRAEELASHVVTSPGQLVETRDRIAEAGFDELILLPTASDLVQLEALETALS
jgi:alkanesulfonate monooxygenase SsuD/methylene tetrahydromethanopterin reductase-like flavin-dependent oxidoreductase (luciferase family)